MASSKLPIIGLILGSAGIIIAVAIFIGISVFVYKKLVKPALQSNLAVEAEENQESNHLEADAVILEMRETGLTVKEYSEIELILEVRPKDEAPFQVRITQAVYRFNVQNYGPGAKLQVRYDPNNLNQFKIVSEPTENASDEKSIEHRLNQLEKLKEKGVINDQEYQHRREEILNDL